MFFNSNYFDSYFIDSINFRLARSTNVSFNLCIVVISTQAASLVGDLEHMHNEAYYYITLLVNRYSLTFSVQLNTHLLFIFSCEGVTVSIMLLVNNDLRDNTPL